MVCQTISFLVFGMDSAVSETDSVPCLFTVCVCWGGGGWGWVGKCLGRAGVQLKSLDIFYISGVPYFFYFILKITM